MIINPTESNENGVVMNQTCRFGYEGHTQICRSSIMRSKWGGGGGKPKAHFRSQGGRGGSGEGLNLLTRYLNSP